MPKKIQEAVTSLKLIKKFGLVGAFSPKLDETVVPVVITDNLEQDPWIEYGVSLRMAAGGVGNYNGAQLRVPDAIGILAHLHKVIVSGTGAAIYQVFTEDAAIDVAATVIGYRLDRRGTLAGGAIMRSASEIYTEVVGAAHGGDRFGVYRRNLTDFAALDFDAYLTPGTGVVVGQDAANEAFEISMYWRERPLNPDGS